MTVRIEDQAEICSLFSAEHFRIVTLATQLHVHADVVRRVLGLLDPPTTQPRPRLCVVEPFSAFIEQTLERSPRLRATRLYDMLQQRGYKGSVRTLRRHVEKVRPAPKAQVFLRTEP